MTPSLFYDKIQAPYHRRASRLLFRQTMSINPQRPLISFTFDDFPASALRCGGAILKHYGLLGTYYVSLGLAGKYAPSGPMFGMDDIQLAHRQGHELGCHTFRHSHSGQTSSLEFEQSINENRDAM